MARLSHPNVIAVHDIGTFGDRVFIAMEYVEGSTLADWMKDAHSIGEVLRSWLEFVPEKVLFGTDAFEISPEVSWADHGWLTMSSARQGLALALTGMMNDGEITRERALELARLVMRDNAVKLYNLKIQ